MTTIDKTAYVWRGSSLIAVHEIGPYAVIEYWSHQADNVPDKRRERLFGTYIDGLSTHYSYASLDEALAGCIAQRHEGPNTRADLYFIRSMSACAEVEREEAAA